MIISHEHKFIFVKTAKTAGTSIEVMLSQLCGTNDVVTPFSRPEPGHHPRNHDGWFDPIPELLVRARSPGFRRPGSELTWRDFRGRHRYYEHLPAWLIKARTSRRVWQDYFKFCVERNPWDKIVSGWYWYQHKYNKQITLDAYLSRVARRIRARLHGAGILPYNFFSYTHPRTGAVLVDRIIPYEELNKGLSSVFSSLGMPFEPPLSIRAKGGLRPSNTPAHRELESQHVAKIGELFASEVQLHGYTYEQSAATQTGRPDD